MRYNNILLILIAIGCILLGFSCQKYESEANDATVNLISYYDTLYNASLTDSVSAVNMLDSVMGIYPVESEALLKVMGYDILSAESLYNLARTKAIQVFSPDVDSHAPSNEDIAKMISNILSAYRDNNLKPINYTYLTTAWGKPQSIIFCDSVMLIGLNHYLGSDYEGYSGLESYRRALKTHEFLPYDIAEALVATEYPYQDVESESLINRMIYEGALAEAKMRLVPDADAAKALGYTNEQYEALLHNEKWIWQKMMTESMVFDHDPMTISRLIAPAPSSSLISSECPGRVGRFIGYRIVKSYLEKHSEKKLDELLSPSFYGKANPLIDMGYNP